MTRKGRKFSKALKRAFRKKLFGTNDVRLTALEQKVRQLELSLVRTRT
jgi:hypothetical protein